jgi:uracil-DNA glycosylase
MLDWDGLRATCLACHKCSLGDTRTHVVFGTGN